MYPAVCELDFISWMSMSAVWRGLGHIYSISPAVIFPLYSDRRQIKQRGDDGRIAFGGRVSVWGLGAAVDSPWDSSSPYLCAKYLITPADTQRAGPEWESCPGRGAEGPGASTLGAAGSPCRPGCTLKFFGRLAGWSTSPWSDGNTWRESGSRWFHSEKQISIDFTVGGFLICHHRLGTAWTFISNTARL